MTFAQPSFLYGLLLVPAAAMFIIWATRRRREAMDRLGDPALLSRLNALVNWRARRWRMVLWFVALALVVIALARPQWGSSVEFVEREGVQIMVAMDVSQSMLAEDLKPNRLERAKLEILDLMSRLDGDEVGLVLFAGASFIQFPLTADYATAATFLRSARPGVISREGTAIAEAIRTAAVGFDKDRLNDRAIILMTDGEDSESDPVEAARQVAEDGVIVYAVGFGSVNGEPIPQYNSRGDLVGYKRDSQGQIVSSKLDETTLREVAAATGGRYYRAGGDGRAIADIAAELGTLQTDQLEREFETKQIERFQGFLLAALLALVLAELMPDRIAGARADRDSGSVTS